MALVKLITGAGMAQKFHALVVMDAASLNHQILLNFAE